MEKYLDCRWKMMMMKMELRKRKPSNKKDISPFFN